MKLSVRFFFHNVMKKKNYKRHIGGGGKGGGEGGGEEGGEGGGEER